LASASRGPAPRTDRSTIKAIDAFYRVQVTLRIALTPTMQMIIEPVRNSNEDVVWVLGIRSRSAF